MDSHKKKLPGATPTRSQQSLPFCNGYGSDNTSSVTRWITDQQQNDTPEAYAQSLLRAINEILVFNTDVETLFSLTELVRPALLNTIHLLVKKHLSNPFILDDAKQTHFVVCAELHRKITLQYRSLAEAGKENKKTDILAQALHRAMMHSTLTTLFFSQLYRPATEGVWSEQHLLYQQATREKLTDFSQTDPCYPKNKALSIAGLYKRSLLLSQSRTNNLNYDDISRVWQVLAIWAPHCKFTKTSGLRTFLAVNLFSDEGLHYALPDPDSEIEGVMGLNVQILIAQLARLKSSSNGNNNKRNTLPFSPQLINHLASAWARISKRKHLRIKTEGSCKIAPGMSAAHYHLTGEQDFNAMVAPYTEDTSDGNDIMSNQERDVWSDVRGREGRKEESKTDDIELVSIQFGNHSVEPEKRFKPIECNIINASDSGCCLETDISSNPNFSIGATVAVCAADSNEWSLAVIRWIETLGSVETLENNKLRTGIQLLPSGTEPCAIALIHKAQRTTAFQRGFILPAQPGKGHNRSLLLSGLAISPGLKFKLLHQGSIKKGQLDQCISSTSTHSEFQYHLFE